MKNTILLTLIFLGLTTAVNGEEVDDRLESSGANDKGSPTIAELLAQLDRVNSQNTKLRAELEQAKEAVREMIKAIQRDNDGLEKDLSILENFDPNPITASDLLERNLVLQRLVVDLQKENTALRNKVKIQAQEQNP